MYERETESVGKNNKIKNKKKQWARVTDLWSEHGFLKKELQSCRDWENKPAVYQWAAEGERNKRDQHCHWAKNKDTGEEVEEQVWGRQRAFTWKACQSWSAKAPISERMWRTSKDADMRLLPSAITYSISFSAGSSWVWKNTTMMLP